MIKRETSTSVTELHSVSERIKRLAISIDGKPAVVQDNNMQAQINQHVLEIPPLPQIKSVLSQSNGNFSDRFEMLNEIGRGGFSIVYKCRERATGEIFAVKVVDLRPLRLREKFNPSRIRREVDIIKRLRHPNIVHFIDVFETEDQLLMVMEYCPGVELFDVILAKNCLPENIAKTIFAQIARALYYLHTLNIIHRDIKPENILILSRTDPSGLPIAKLLDFGLSKNAGNGSAAKTFVGTPCYLAPEVEMTSRGLGTTYGLPADCWSVGAVLYVMLVARFPEFEPDASGKIVLRLSPALWGHISEDAKDLIRSLMNGNPAARMTMSGALQHPWLGEYRATPSELMLAAQQSYDFSQGLQDEEEAFCKDKERSNDKVDDVELSSSGLAHHKTAMVIRKKGPATSYGGVQSDFPVGPLLNLQRSIAICFDEAHACYQHIPESATLVRKGATLCRHQLTESTKMLRHVEQTAATVLEMFPDLELAVEEGEPRLASEFFNVVRQWVVQLRETVASTQAANRASMDEIQSIVEVSARDLQSRQRAAKTFTIPNRVADLLKYHVANASCAGNTKAIEDAATDDHGNITLTSEQVLDLFYSLFNTPQTQKGNTTERSTSQVEVLSSPGQSFGSDTENIRENVGKSRENSLDIDDTVRICDDRLDRLEGRKSWSDPEVNSTFHEMSSAESELAAYARMDTRDGIAFAVPSNTQAGRGETDSQNPFNAQPAPRSPGNDSSYPMSSSNIQLPGTLRPPPLSPDFGQMSSMSSSSTVDISLHAEESKAVAASSSPIAATRLAEALSKLRQVDHILEQLSVFWANTEVILDILTKKGQHVEQFLGFATKPKLFARFKERLEEYKRFWEEVRMMCNTYITGVQQGQVQSTTIMPGMYSFLDKNVMDTEVRSPPQILSSKSSGFSGRSGVA